MLTAGFTDTANATGAVGPACCQVEDLSNPISQLSNRFDYLFERGFSSIGSEFLVGDQVFQDLPPLWPSDHAGVVATVDLAEPSMGLLFVSATLLLGTLRLLDRR